MGKQPWDRMADEGARDYHVFSEFYLPQDPMGSAYGRTVEEAWRRYRSTVSNEKPGSAQPHFKQLAKRMDWKERASAYDEYLARERRKAREQEMLKQEKARAREHEKAREKWEEVESKLLTRAISVLEDDEIQANLGHAASLIGRAIDIFALREQLEKRTEPEDESEGSDLVEEFLKEVRSGEAAGVASEVRNDTA